MRDFLDVEERLFLRVTARLHGSAQVRRRIRWLLYLDRGEPLTRLARSEACGRQTVYRYVGLYLSYRSVEVLRSEGSGRLLLTLRRHPRP